MFTAAILTGCILPMNLPQQLLQELEGTPGYDRAAFIAAHDQPAVTSIRLNPAKPFAAGTTERVPWCAAGFYLPQRPVFTLDPAYHAGAYYVQEASSMFTDYLFRAVFPDRTQLRVLDLCAAPGGKSTLLAAALEGDSLLVSNEVIRTRASILEENMSRWGYKNTWVTSNDPRDFARLPGYFDAIVVDAPCSGSGLFRKDARALDEWSEQNVQLCSQRQQRILADVWPALKQDGVLLYATCSYSPGEDEQVLDWLAEDLEAETIGIAVPPEWGVQEVVSPVHGVKGYRFFPHRLQGEGFFIAAVRKTQDTPDFRYPKFKSTAQKQIAQQAAFLLQENLDVTAVKTGDSYAAINSLHEPDLHALSAAVYLRKTGLELGMPSAKEWLPAHDIALSVDVRNSLPRIDTTQEQALRFLKKEDAGLPGNPKGWYLVSYEGLGLGWVKSLGNRYNNYLPKHWRIRMDISDADWA